MVRSHVIQQAFTLVELCIVLVILGLLAGGVLSGKSLIRGAELRNTLKTMNDINSASLVFKEKYIALPGDWAMASQFFPGEINGNGDGRIRDLNGGGSFLGERKTFFKHLAKAQLITNLKGPDPEFITVEVPIGGQMLVIDTSEAMESGLAATSGTPFLTFSGHAFVIGIKPDIPQEWFDIVFSISPLEAHQIDTKIDDGNPFTGNMNVTYLNTGDDHSFGAALDAPAASNACVSNATGNPYMVSDSNPLCAIVIKAAF